MSLRTALTRDATLPDGQVVHVRVGIADDSYIPSRELNTVTIELRNDHVHLAAVSTVLDVDQESEGLQLLREVVEGLESGDLEPTAGAIEPLADRLRSI
jgi:hypothetical protein